MTGWDERDAAGIGRAGELRIAPMRRDGTLQRPRSIWVVRLTGRAARATIRLVPS